MTEHITRLERFAADRAVRILIGLTILMLLATAAGGYILVNAQRQLTGVEYAGPCRAKGLKYNECRALARLVVAACADQPQQCARKYGIRVVRVRDGR